MRDRRPHWWPARSEWLAMAAVLLAVGLVVQPLEERGHLKAQQAARMALTSAVADHGTLRLDRYAHVLGVDYAIRDGHRYSDKAPLQPLLAVPPYLAYRAVGGESAEIRRGDFNLGLWWISLLFAAVPAAVLVAAMARLARPWARRWGLPAALAMSFGTLLLPFGTLLFSHTLSALLVTGALLACRTMADRPRQGVLAGALLGCAVANEYTTGAALLVIGAAYVVRHRWTARWLALGAAGPLLALAAYHWTILGSPVRVPYQFHNLELQNAGTRLPTLDRCWALISSGRGAFLLAPVVLLGLVGLVLAARERPERRTEVAVAAALFAAFFLVQAGAADAGGESLGPRYLIPALPPLVIGLAVLWPRVPALCAGVAATSAALMLLASYTDPLPPLEVGGLVPHWIDRIADGAMVDTLLEPLLGRAAIPLVLASAVGLAVASVRAHRAEVAAAGWEPAAGAVSPRRAARASGP